MIAALSEPGVRSSISGVLRDEGFEVDTVGTGEECLERANSDAYDVIVLDIWLPGLDGLEVPASAHKKRLLEQLAQRARRQSERPDSESTHPVGDETLFPRRARECGQLEEEVDGSGHCCDRRAPA